MSTVFIGGKVLQSEYWQLHDILKKHIIAEHLLLSNYHPERNPDADLVKFSDLAKREQFHYKMQVFEIGDWYYFRFLETGYFISNNIEKWKPYPASFQFIGFHTGSQSEDEIDEMYGAGTFRQVRDLDRLIYEQHYFIAILVDADTLWAELWELARAARKAAKEK